MRLVLLAALLAAFAGPHPVTESAASGDVRAMFTYSVSDDGLYTGLRLVVERGGVTALDRAPKPICPGCATWPGSQSGAGSSSLHVADLDRNGEPVVMLDLYTGGAHCCLYTVFFRWNGTEYVSTRHDWSNPGYRYTDIGHDGIPEFVTRDDRFNYAFSCYACSAAPVRILRVVRTELVDVTRRFPAVIRTDASELWREYRSAVRRRQDVSGLLPAYVADECLLGRAVSGWARLRRAVSRSDWSHTVTETPWRNRARYRVAVRRFLRRTGYLR